MTDTNSPAFIRLFKQAHLKCFGFELASSLSETECKHFSNKIYEETGLVIGAKSLKNYAADIISSDGSKQNPSVATLDTMARYVLEAPYTDEVQRKDKEGHYPYWYRYKNSFAVRGKKDVQPKNRSRWGFILIVAMAVIIFLLCKLLSPKKEESFTDYFNSLNNDSLKNNGWFVQLKDTAWWNRRRENPRGLILFTLRGDNWPDSANAPAIKNLLLRKISSDCFTAEIHMAHFIPKANWQQAGILLMEDTALASKTVRLSIAYNDFFGGFSRSKEIIIQGITSGGKDFTRPEEIAHIPIFTPDSTQENLVEKNLAYSALRIEKNNNHFRFLYSSSPVENFAFKEAFSKDISIKPRYIGLFALQGFVDNNAHIPVHITFFKLSGMPCEK